MTTLPKKLLLFFAACAVIACGAAAVAQETVAPDAAGDEPAEAESLPGTDDDEPELIDDPELDEQTYEEDEDVFVPTEEIPSDEPIPFPTNI